tara:strand:+ start:1845 stop:2624 length:780 start_codon:yes stop_codon:yes gene_type:complete
MSNKKTKKSGLAPAAFASDPMAQIDALIKEAKRLKKNQDQINKPKKRFDQGGSNTGKNTKTISNEDRKRLDELLSKFKKIDEPGPVDIKNLKKILSKQKGMNKGGNFSSKELIMKATQPKKPKTFKEAFAAARAKLGPGKVFTFKGKKYTTDRADDKKKKSKKSKNFSSKSLITEKSVKSGIPKKKTNFSSKSLITKKSIQSGVPKTKKKVLTQNPFKNPTPPVVATKSKTTTVAQNPFKNPNPPIKKMNKGGVFKGIF